MPPPDVQKWFVHVSQRFESKPLSGSILEKFSDELNIPPNVLISLKHETGTLTARAIVRYLFPSKSRTLEDITGLVRRSILSKNRWAIVGENNDKPIPCCFLDYVQFCHPNELFVRGKINEAISGPFRTAKFKTNHARDTQFK